MPKPSLLRAAVLAMALLLPSAARATTITIVNLDSAGIGLNDTTPAAPVGGNPGTTKGAQALNVFQRAASLWAAKLVSSVVREVSTVRLRVSFKEVLIT